MQYPLIKPKYYVSLFNDIIGFIKKPKNEENLEKSVKFKIYDTIGLFILKLIFLIPLFLFFGLVYDPENVGISNISERFTPLLFLLLGGVIFPFIEEVAFRLSLKFNPKYFALTSGVLTFYILTKLIFNTKMSVIDESFVIRIVTSILIGVIVYPIVNIERFKEKLAVFWKSHFRSIYYISCLIFAWIHITMYEVNLINILLLPILTLPQLLDAITLGYIRVSFGFKYPLFFHMSNNLIGIGLSFLPFTDLIAN